MRVTQDDLNRIVPEIIEAYGPLPDDEIVEKVKGYGFECKLEDVMLHFEPTINEEIEDLEMIYQPYM